MAIDINNRLGGLTQTNAKAADQAADGAKAKAKAGDAASREADARDAVKISDDAAALQAMQTRLERQESFDEARVSEIRQAIESGQYPIDNQRLAENFLKLESKL
jgi:negative regulator of flagellin synthesis FlgM